MVDRHLTIGGLAKRSGVVTSALRCWEELGLMPARSGSCQRRYPESAIGLLGVILCSETPRHAPSRNFGLGGPFYLGRKDLV